MTREGGAPPAAADVGSFCRDVEAHLCRVNGGHLVRIVGPAFELVAGWALEGIPLRIVLNGVERTVARLTAKGPRRRPVRIEFCEADVRDAFDQWRRATGVHARAFAGAGGATDATAPAPPVSRQPSLPKHLERVLVRLSAIGATHELSPAMRGVVDAAIRDVDACLDAARGARGEARAAVIAQLAAIDEALMASAAATLADARRADLRAEAARELAPHRTRMSTSAWHEAEQALFGELVRRHLALPQVRLDG